MDLGAFSNIDIINHVMTDNNISVPRLRGLRLMALEEPVTGEKLEAAIRDIALNDCEDACCSDFRYDAFAYEYSMRTRKIKKKYMVLDENHYPTGIRWDRIHGKKRKLFKYIFRNTRKKVMRTYAAFNKYCGRNDILYIHARIGGGNWPYYRKEVEGKPWFIEKIDDPFDATYCDIYARIDPRTINMDINGRTS